MLSSACTVRAAQELSPTPIPTVNKQPDCPPTDDRCARFGVHTDRGIKQQTGTSTIHAPAGTTKVGNEGSQAKATGCMDQPFRHSRRQSTVLVPRTEEQGLL